MTSYCGGEGVSGAGKTWRCCSDDSSRHDFEGCREDLVSVNTLVTSRFHCAGEKKVLGQQKRSRISVLFQCSLMVCCLFCRVAGCHHFGRYVVFLVGLQAVTVLDGMLSPLSGCRLSQFWMVCCLLYRVAGCHSGGCCLLEPALPCAHAFCAASCLCCVPLCGAWLCDLFDFQNCGIGKTWTAQLGGHCTRNANLSLT